MKFCGTLRINVELIAPISGRFRAAAINLSRLFARNWTSRPARSSSTNVKPPAVPTPGMAGGEKLKGGPAGRRLGFLFQRALRAFKFFPPPFRSPTSGEHTPELPPPH